MGVTAKERARPASVAAAGSIPAISTHGMWCKGQRARSGAEQTGFESLLPDSGSLVKSESHAVETREVPGRFRGEPLVPYWSNG